MVRRAAHVAYTGKKTNTYRSLVGDPEGKRELGRPRCGLENNNKMHLEERDWKAEVWILRAEDRDQWLFLVKIVINLRALGKVINSSTS
jgi:hypothetical protein